MFTSLRLLDNEFAAFVRDPNCKQICGEFPHTHLRNLSALPFSPSVENFYPNSRRLAVVAGLENDWSPLMNILFGHAFSPDGKRVVSGLC